MENLEGERWKWLEGCEGRYEVSDKGRVRSRTRNPDKPQIMSPWKSNNGYMNVGIRYSKGARFKARTIHRLVLLAFVGPCPDGMACNHKNGDKADNRVENLEWATPSENMLHCFRKLHPECFATGIDHYNGKLSDAHVAKIRALASEGMRQREIADMFNITQSYVSHIVSGRVRRKASTFSGSSVEPSLAKRTYNVRKLNPEKVREIRQLKRDGTKLQDIADKMSVSRSTIIKILAGDRWADVSD